MKRTPKEYATKILNERITALEPCNFCEHNCLLGVCKQQIETAKFICIEQMKVVVDEHKSSFCGAHLRGLEIRYYNEVIDELKKV